MLSALADYLAVVLILAAAFAFWFAIYRLIGAWVRWRAK